MHGVGWGEVLAEGEGERIPAFSPLSVEPEAGLRSQDPEIMT